jgi:hypothetical protein
MRADDEISCKLLVKAGKSADRESCTARQTNTKKRTLRRRRRFKHFARLPFRLLLLLDAKQQITTSSRLGLSW